ncbi:hypothetical protein LNA01_17380 [Companilactobacillus nantensis]|nr:hypothetical protein LNA01_17380 [Companilactobacillus nantensis]
MHNATFFFADYLYIKWYNRLIKPLMKKEYTFEKVVRPIFNWYLFKNLSKKVPLDYATAKSLAITHLLK